MSVESIPNCDFAQKVSAYAKMFPDGNFLHLLKLTLDDADKFNALLCKLETVADSFVQELSNKEELFTKINKVLTQGTTSIKISTPDISYQSKIPIYALYKSLPKRDVVYVVSGNKYSGEWKDGFHHGLGKMTFANGSYYQGNFVNGNFEGEGEYKDIRKNGTIGHYKGNFIKGRFAGEGEHTLSHINKNKVKHYKGNFVNGEYSGFGIFTSSNGHYVGNFVSNKFEGKGKYFWTNGDCYEGEFHDNKFHGQGILTNLEKNLEINKYEGMFANNKFNGCGILIKSNGDRFEGNFANNKYNGCGILIKSNGERFEGNFINGVFIDDKKIKKKSFLERLGIGKKTSYSNLN